MYFAKYKTVTICLIFLSTFFYSCFGLSRFRNLANAITVELRLCFLIYQQILLISFRKFSLLYGVLFFSCRKRKVKECLEWSMLWESMFRATTREANIKMSFKDLRAIKSHEVFLETSLYVTSDPRGGHHMSIFVLASRPIFLVEN